MTNTTKMPWMKEDHTIRKLMTWKEAVRVIQTLVDEKNNKRTKQAWDRIFTRMNRMLMTNTTKIRKLMTWKEAIRVIQTLVDRKDTDERTKQAWDRILQG